METIAEAVTRHRAQRPDAPALVDDRFRLSWGEAADRMDATAGWLTAKGFQRGRPVLAWLPNCAEWNLLRFACERAGLPFIPVPASQGRRELKSILESLGAALLISKGKFRKRDFEAECAEICGQLGEPPERLTLPDDALLDLEGPKPTAPPLGLDEVVHALATSGSEGIPKIAHYTGAAAGRRALGQIEILELRADDIFLVLSHGTGPARPAWLAAPMIGASIVTMPIFSAAPALRLIEAERPSLVCATPAQLAMIAPGLGGIDAGSVRIWYTSGAVMPASLAEELESVTGAAVVSTYGGADFGGWACPAPGDAPDVRRHTVGKPRGGTEFRLVDTNGTDVAPGEIGHLIGRGPCCAGGYLGEAGPGSWIDGWFQTGDLARRDDRGNYSIIGRMNAVIVRGGDKVIPAEIETLLRTHTDIDQVAVVPVPDPILGERVCACVVAVVGKPVALEPLRQFLRERGVAYYKIPERLVVMDALPLVGDKIDQRKLSEIAAAAAGNDEG